MQILLKAKIGSRLQGRKLLLIRVDSTKLDKKKLRRAVKALIRDETYTVVPLVG